MWQVCHVDEYCYFVVYVLVSRRLNAELEAKTAGLIQEAEDVMVSR